MSIPLVLIDIFTFLTHDSRQSDLRYNNNNITRRGSSC